MIASMTGFGKSACDFQNKKINVEIRSVNSKQLDLALRIPSRYKDLENEIRSIFNEKCLRGKIDCYISVKDVHGVSEDNLKILHFNTDQISSYLQELPSLMETLEKKSTISISSVSQESLMKMLFSLPNVIHSEDTEDVAEISAEEKDSILSTLHSAIEIFEESRNKEGEVLEKDFRLRIGLIEQLLSKIEPFEKQRIETLKTRLRSHLEELKLSQEIDANRFEQELIYYLEKWDVTEEKVRLKKHIDYFLATLSERGAGKKLNFITQEIGREINTLGSKSNEASMQKIVVQMKDELEKIKEQLFNIL